MNNPIVITGYGPRVGTSFLMRWLRDEGHLVHGSQYTCPGEDGSLIRMPIPLNTGGYYECPVTDLSLMRDMGGFTKIWPGRLQAQEHEFKPKAIIALKRSDRFAQIRSAERQLAAEVEMNPKLVCAYKTGMIASPQEIVADATERLADYLSNYDGPVLQVQTEDLDYQIKHSIPHFIEDCLDEEH